MMRGVLAAIFVVISVTSPAVATIKIGFAHVFSGPMATFGEVARQGAELAVKEINAAGGINGQSIEVVYADTAAKPDVGVQAVQNLVEKDKVDIVIGLVSSAVAIAVTPVMNDLKCPLIVTHAMAEEVTGSKCNPWVFRITWNLDQCFKGSAALGHSLGAKRWTTLGPNYGFGQDSWKYFQKYLAQMGQYSFDTGEFVPMSTTDWKPIVKKLATSGADGVMISLWGNNLRDFIRQANEEKFFENRRVLCPVGGSVEIFTALGFLDMPQGLWFGAPYWYEAYQNQFNNAFVTAYTALSPSRIPPSYAAYNSFAAVKMLQGAIGKSGSSDRAAIAKGLSGLTVSDMPVGPVTFREEDHQATYDIVFGKTGKAAAKGSRRIRGLNTIRRFAGKDVTPPVSDTGCAMNRLK
jgi:branched-chain amino acid transport system substrate-binding protein